MEHLTDDPFEVILKLKRLEGEVTRQCYPTAEMAQCNYSTETVSLLSRMHLQCAEQMNSSM